MPNPSLEWTRGRGLPGEGAERVALANVERNLQDDVDFGKPRSTFRCQVDEAGSDKETDDACDGVCEGDRRQ